MPEHYTRNTISAEAWCAKCQKRTQHRIDDRRIGPCLDCIARLEKRYGELPKAPVAKQASLFLSETL